MGNSKYFVFTTLAINQTQFFIGMAKNLQKLGHKCLIISFHQKSNQYIRDAGIECFDMYGLSDPESIKDEHIPSILDKFQITNPNLILSHHKLVFQIFDTKPLLKQFLSFLLTADSLFQNLLSKNKDCIVLQEFGGFISLTATFYAARKNRIEHYFTEPSFFKGRVFFTHNTFSSCFIPIKKDVVPSNEVKCYLNEVTLSQSILIPLKDRSHYKKASKKIFNLYNLKRLFQKLYEKYIKGEREEFNFLSVHIEKHLKMFINSLRSISFYTGIPDEPFVYYPLHVPLDAALTIRSPEYLDQLSIVEYLLRNIPYGYKVVIKEHPAQVGALHYSRTRELVKKYENLVILNPFKNNYKILKMAKAVVTINSKSGAEALICGARVFVLGDAFYRNFENCVQVSSLSDLKEGLNSLERIPTPTNEQNLIMFENVWQNTYQGEIHDGTEENTRVFAQSFLEYLENTSIENVKSSLPPEVLADEKMITPDPLTFN